MVTLQRIDPIKLPTSIMIKIFLINPGARLQSPEGGRNQARAAAAVLVPEEPQVVPDSRMIVETLIGSMVRKTGVVL